MSLKELNPSKITPHWEKIGKHPRHGVAVHLAALRSKNSSGIGEFLDLIPLINWAHELGLGCIQLLAINDSGYDPSPYNPMSSIALDPVFLSLESLKIQADFTKETLSKRVNKSAVLNKKKELLFHYFQTKFKKEEEYFLFIQNQEWLQKYAHFKALDHFHKHAPWKSWDPTSKPNEALIDFYLFLQFLCFKQMSFVHTYAKKKQVLILGDLPVLVSEHSVDVWGSPHFFHLGITAGCPPDFFNIHGQNWGFPILNRKNVEENGYLWWENRLRYAENFFDCYRIDHVIGLFRIWGIRKDDPPLQGSFYPKSSKLWSQNGKNALEAFLRCSHLLPIAEDLGTLSKGMKQVLKKMQIPTTCLIPHMRTKGGLGKYIPFDQYPEASISTLSTHDLPILEDWWMSHPEWAADFASFLKIPYKPLLTKEMKLDILKISHQTPSLFRVNQLQEYLTLIPELSWTNPMEERINLPGTFLPSNWTYRYRAFIEDIVNNQELKNVLRSSLPLPTLH